MFVPEQLASEIALGDAVIIKLRQQQPLTRQHLIIQGQARIRPIDWESAAIGLGAWDLARLLDHAGPDRADYLASYLAELDRLDATPLDLQAFRRIFHRSCRMLNALWRLGSSVEACRDPAFVIPLLDEIEASWESS